MRIFDDKRSVTKLKENVQKSMDLALAVLEKTRSRTSRARSVQEALKKEMERLQLIMEDSAKINNKQVFQGAFKFQKAFGGIYSFVSVMVPEMDFMQVMIQINVSFREALMDYIDVAQDFCESVEDFYMATEMDRRLLEEFKKANQRAAFKMRELGRIINSLKIHHVDVAHFVATDADADEAFTRMRRELGLETETDKTEDKMEDKTEEVIRSLYPNSERTRSREERGNKQGNI